MREIKFRAWDKKVKEMIYDALEIRNIGIGDGSVLIDSRAQRGNELIWLQYTGLKDRGDREAYEADLIQNEYGRICEIAWCQSHGQWDAKIRKAINNDKPNGFSPEEWWHSVKIIGNIYENPELMAAKKGEKGGKK